MQLVEMKQELRNSGRLSLFGIGLACFILFVTIRYAYLETSLRLVVYALPVLLGGLYLIRRFQHRPIATESTALIKSYFLPLFILYAGLAGLSLIVLVLNHQLSLRYIEELLFIFVPLIASAMLLLLYDKSNNQHWVRILFWGICLAFLVETRFQLLRGIDDVVFAVMRAGFLESTGIRTESVLAFSFGLFALIFIQKRDYTHMVIALLMFVIAYKRVAILGLGITIVAAPILNILFRYNSFRRYLPYIAALANLVFAMMIVLVGSGSFDGVITNSLAIDPDELTLGRRELYEDIINRFDIRPDNLPIVGYGLGSITNYLESEGSNLVNPHSDILKNMIEFGMIGFSIWFIVLYNRQLRTFTGLMLMIYVNLIWMSDNVSIYFEVMFLFYTLSAFAILNTEPPSIHENRIHAHTTDS